MNNEGDSAADPTRPMAADVFICYSRRDRAFVERLHSVLVSEGKDVWVDWEDVPAWSSDYEVELLEAVAACDAFLFVLSPDSLASPHCKLELDLAVEQGKRIKPLLRRDVADASVPEPVQKPQWIDFTDEDSFAAAAETLVQALAVDVEWVRIHTRIGVRAAEWDRRGRDKSYLLRGSDLRTAEAWLQGQPGKEPPATARQLEYLSASRRAATRRQQVALLAVAVALGISVSLAVLAVIQRNDAVHAAHLAQSRELAGQATLQLDVDPERSILLATEAERAAATPEADAALRRALVASRVRLRLPAGAVGGVGPSPRSAPTAGES